jgi:diguanylate cyclase (GGDEF)-like protein
MTSLSDRRGDRRRGPHAIGSGRSLASTGRRYGATIAVLVTVWVVGLGALATVVTTQATVHRETRTLLAVAALERDLMTLNLSVFRPALATPIHPSEAQSRLAIESGMRRLRASLATLAATTNDAESRRIAADVDEYLAGVDRIATQIIRDHSLSSAAAAVGHTYAPGGSYVTLTDELRHTSTSSRTELEDARRMGLVSEIVAFALMLLAFSIALHRATRSSREKQELLERSRVEANTDALTGLSNRRKLFADMETFHVERRSPGELAVGMFDLDGFKDYNDTFGHPDGDRLLARLGARLTSAVNGRGRAYRMGGDEFCVVALGKHPEDILVAAAEALSERGEHFNVTCSRGFVAVTSTEMTLEQALQQADQRLYANKNSLRARSAGTPPDVALSA